MTEQEAMTLTVTVEQPLVPKESYNLPEFRLDRSCVKCGSDAVITRYHCDIANWEPCYEIWQEHFRDAEIMASPSHNFPEHMDKTCSLCGYEWCEAVL